MEVESLKARALCLENAAMLELSRAPVRMLLPAEVQRIIKEMAALLVAMGAELERIDGIMGID